MGRRGEQRVALVLLRRTCRAARHQSLFFTMLRLWVINSNPILFALEFAVEIKSAPVRRRRGGGRLIGDQ